MAVHRVVSGWLGREGACIIVMGLLADLLDRFGIN